MPGPIAWTISRVVQSAKTACRGTRIASQNVPLRRRPRTGGSARVPDMVEAALTESFLDGDDVVTPGCAPGRGSSYLSGGIWPSKDQNESPHRPLGTLGETGEGRKRKARRKVAKESEGNPKSTGIVSCQFC